MNWILLLISGMCTVAWTIALFHIGKAKKGKDIWFYPMLYAPLAVGIIISLYFSPEMLWFMLSIKGAIVLMIFVLERLLWGWALKDASGEDDFRWFLVIFVFETIGWMIYYYVTRDKSSKWKNLIYVLAGLFIFAALILWRFI